MKFILELESREVAHLSKTGILEAVIKELEENNQIVKSEKEEKAEQVTVILPDETPEVETVIEKTEETTKDKKGVEANSIISKEEFKKRLVALSKSGKKDEVKAVLKAHGYVKVSEVKEEEFEMILKELS